MTSHHVTERSFCVAEDDCLCELSWPTVSDAALLCSLYQSVIKVIICSLGRWAHRPMGCHCPSARLVLLDTSHLRLRQSTSLYEITGQGCTRRVHMKHSMLQLQYYTSGLHTGKLLQAMHKLTLSSRLSQSAVRLHTVFQRQLSLLAPALLSLDLLGCRARFCLVASSMAMHIPLRCSVLQYAQS